MSLVLVYAKSRTKSTSHRWLTVALSGCDHWHERAMARLQLALDLTLLQHCWEMISLHCSWIKNWLGEDSFLAFTDGDIFDAFYVCWLPISHQNISSKRSTLKGSLLVASFEQTVDGNVDHGEAGMSVNEQTIGFKGSSSMMLQISYKKEGSGFQCDTICDRGYTLAFYFHHGEPPELPSMLDDLKLPPTAHRVVWLARQLPNQWTWMYMDNLFNSQKLLSALYHSKDFSTWCDTNTR